jgi:hypothetical protein
MDTRNIRYAFGEGALEAGMVENQMTDDLSKEWLAEHPGQRIDEKTAKSIRDTAKQAAVTTAITNTPAILYSNKIVLDGLLRPAQFSRKIGGELIESGLGKKFVFAPVAGVKDAYRKLPKNFLKRQWAYAKDPRLALAVGADGAIKYTAANLTEGFQEIFQEVISGTNEDYYTAQYKGDLTRGGYYAYVARNIEKQMTPEGFEVFMSGFLMGGLAGPVSTAAGKSIATATELFDPNSDIRIRGIRYGEREDGTGKYFTFGKAGQAIGIGTGTEAQIEAAEKKDREREEMLDEVVNTLNEFYADPDKYLSPEMENMLTQKTLNTMMKQAQEEGDVKAYNDFKDSSGFKHVLTALQYGRLGNHINQLKELKGLTAEEVQQKYRISKEQFDSNIDKAVARAERIETRYNKAQELFPDPIGNINQYKGQLRIQAAIAKSAWRSAVEEFVFSQDSFDNAVERAESILAKAKDKARLNNVPASKFNALFSLKGTQAEINILKSEVQALEEGGIKKSDPKLKSLKQQLKYLEQYAKAMESAKADRIASNTETIKPGSKFRAKFAFISYLKELAKDNDDYVSNERLDEVFEDVLDYASLSERKQKAMDAVNLLTNPESFQENFNRILEIKQQIYDNRKEEIKTSLKQYEAAMAQNKLQQELHKAGMFFSLEELKELEENGTFPTTFYYTNVDTKAAEELSSLEVQKNTEDYKKAIAIVKAAYPEVQGIPIAEEIMGTLYNASVRGKLKNDNRTLADLADQFGFKDGEKVPLKQVLQAIVDSKFATAQEKLLAAELLNIADDRETVTFSTTMGFPGEYSESTQTKVDPRFGAKEYKKADIRAIRKDYGQLGAQGKDLPLEAIILRFEIQRRTTEALNENGDFKSSIKTLRDEAFARFAEMADNQQDVNFAFLNYLEDDQAFVEGVMTNKGFQEFLAGIPSQMSTTGKNVWQKFVDSVLDAIKKKFGNKPNGTVLNTAMDLITAEIGLDYADTATETVEEEVVEESSEEEQQPETEEEEVEIIDAVSTDQTPTSLYDKYPDFMDTMVVMYKEQSRARVENDEDPLGIFEKKNGEELTNKELVETTGFKTWWKQKFNKNKNAAIDTFNATYTIGTLSGDSLFTDAEVNNAKNTGTIPRVKLVKLADKITSQQELSQQEQNMSAIPAIQNALATLQEQREKDRKGLSKKVIIDTPMKNALRALGFTDVAINKMSIPDAQKIITDGIPYSELKKQQAQEEKKVKTKQNKKRDIARKTVIEKFENSQTIDELDQQYEQFTALIATNENGIADALELQTFSLDELRQKNIDRIASLLNFDDLYVGNAVLLTDGNIAIVDSVNKNTGVIILEYVKSDRGITITRDNLTKFVKARFSEAYKLSTESKKGKQVTEEETKTHQQSTEIAKSETEQIEEANKEALSKTDEERTNSFLDSTIKRCK